ncbi:Na+/H+ antiporter subunit E [Tessaracoccus sp. OS52]|uniref:Na+/H+ antiporter subunit E n=1 Tax=Tessaracoccus sp. OS52 TaxID=2886691 RepID=UPI001D116BDE|nr:Na+/H+ antiporter subunit E [Tessaracoccus sp. OS52]MCC2593974.1 Na+/H+ antiporter subunit E [Tessaracoccus sp. OS52]
MNTEPVRQKGWKKSEWRSGPSFLPLSVVVMTGVWVFLWGDFAPFGIISGIAIAWLVKAQFPMPPVYWPGTLHPLGAIRLLYALLRDLVVSSWRVVRLTLDPRRELRPGIVRVSQYTDVDLYQVQVAELISLVPGTVVVELVSNPRRLYLHVLDMDENHDAEAVRAMATEIEHRVLEAFGSRDEQDRFAREHDRPVRRRRSGFMDRWEIEQ